MELATKTFTVWAGKPPRQEAVTVAFHTTLIGPGGTKKRVKIAIANVVDCDVASVKMCVAALEFADNQLVVTGTVRNRCKGKTVQKRKNMGKENDGVPQPMMEFIEAMLLKLNSKLRTASASLQARFAAAVAAAPVVAAVPAAAPRARGAKRARVSASQLTAMLTKNASLCIGVRKRTHIVVVCGVFHEVHPQDLALVHDTSDTALTDVSYTAHKSMVMVTIVLPGASASRRRKFCYGRYVFKVGDVVSSCAINVSDGK